VWWVGPPALVGAKLRSPQKREFMSDRLSQAYGEVALRSIECAVTGALDLRSMSAAMATETQDGIHYTDALYARVASLILCAVGGTTAATPSTAAMASSA
jgi:hypothetical protein